MCSNLPSAIHYLIYHALVIFIYLDFSLQTIRFFLLSLVHIVILPKNPFHLSLSG